MLMARILILLLFVGASLGFHVLQQRHGRMLPLYMQSPVRNMDLEKFARILRDDAMRLVGRIIS